MHVQTKVAEIKYDTVSPFSAYVVCTEEPLYSGHLGTRCDCFDY